MRVLLVVDVLLDGTVPLRLVPLVDTVDLAAGLYLHVRISQNEFANRLIGNVCLRQESALGLTYRVEHESVDGPVAECEHDHGGTAVQCVPSRYLNQQSVSQSGDLLVHPQLTQLTSFLQSIRLGWSARGQLHNERDSH